MHIQKIEIKNYGPFYGEHEFVFQDRGLTLIMGDNQDEPRMNSNGAGKCLVGSTKMFDPINSKICTIAEMYLSWQGGCRDWQVLGLSDNLKLVPVGVEDVVSTGKKSCIEIVFDDGSTIRVSETHPLLAQDLDVVKAESVYPGDYLATPRKLPGTGVEYLNLDEAYLLGVYIADGGLTGDSITFTKKDPIVVSKVAESLGRLFNLEIVSVGKYGWHTRRKKACDVEAIRKEILNVFKLNDISFSVMGNNLQRALRLESSLSWENLIAFSEEYGIPKFRKLAEQLYPVRALKSFLSTMGVLGKLSKEKRLSKFLFSSTVDVVSVFVASFWDCDGYVSELTGNEVSITSASEGLIDDFQLLLKRFGIYSRKRVKKCKSPYSAWQLTLSMSVENVRNFWEFCGHKLVTFKKARLEQLMTRQGGTISNNNVDVIPSVLTSRIIDAELISKNKPLNNKELKLQYTRSQLRMHCLSRSKVGAYSEYLDSVELSNLANSDIYWKKVVSVHDIGIQETFDISIGTENHLYATANVITHNSSILDGLDFCLFGRIPRQDHVDSIVNDESKSCSVCVYLKDDLGREIRVRRERSKTTTLQLYIDGELHESLDIKETQKEVEAMLGVDRDVFHAAVLFAQTDLTHYAESGDVERMSILTKILQLEEIDHYLEVAKGFDRKVRQKWDALTVKIDGKKQVLANLVDKGLETDIANWEEGRQKKLANLKQLMEAKLTERDQCLRDLDNVGMVNSVQLEYLRKSLTELRLPDDTGIREASGRAQVLEVELAGLVNQYKARADELIVWKKKGEGICSECNQVITAEHLRVEIQKLEAELAFRQGELDAKSRESSVVRLVIGENKAIYDGALVKYQEEIQRLNYEIGVGEQQITQAQMIRNRIDAIDLEARRFYKMAMGVEAEENPWVKQRDENRREFRSVGLELNELETQINVVVDDLKYIDFWLSAFSSKGLKSYILDARLQELTDAVNQWVTVLTGGTIWVQFSTQKKTRSQKLVNSPTVRICRWNPDGTITERNFNSWSGGEKQRISFAIDFGLSRLIAQRAKKTYNLLILDEVFRHLDQAGKEAIMEMLQVLAREKSSVFVVEHDTDFQSAFENRVLVQKKNRRSTIVELSNEQSNGIENEAEATGTTEKREILPLKDVGGGGVVRTPF